VYKQPIPAYIREREEAAAQPSDTRTYFDPEAFEWFGRVKRKPFLRISERVYISVAALKLAGINAGDRVLLGVNKKYVALRKAGEEGCKVVFNHGAWFWTPKNFPVKGTIEVKWDGNMLVGRRPEEASQRTEGGVGDE